MKSGGDYKKSDLLKKGCMNMRQLKTKWADNINEKNVLGEYPRPLMRRKSYVNLNGVWKYAIKDTKGFPKKMNGDILVPFSPEAALSGVGRQLKPDEFLWYKRSLPEEIRPEAGSRWLLHFGAVDQCAVCLCKWKETRKTCGRISAVFIRCYGCIARRKKYTDNKSKRLFRYILLQQGKTEIRKWRDVLYGAKWNLANGMDGKGSGVSHQRSEDHTAL